MAAKKKKDIEVIEPVVVPVGVGEVMSVTQVEVNETEELKPETPVNKEHKRPSQAFNEVHIDFLRMVFLSNNIGSVRGPELAHSLTHARDVRLPAYEFGIELLKYKAGQLYAQALDQEKNKLERNHLISLKKEDDGKVYVTVPDWNLLMTALDIYFKMNGPY